jgi:glycosyltransferase involved in cell wall biosynthesis
VNPSIKEGWGITNIEANACGTPVVSADSPGLRDSVKIDVSGKLYPYGDIRVLQETLIDILTDSAKRTALSHTAVSYAAGFSWDESASAMEELLSTCIASHE